MIDPDDMPDDFDDHARAFGEAALELNARWEASGMDDKLRRLGVYVDQVQIVPGPTGQPVIALLAQLGAVAFTDRVLDPEKDKIEDQFRAMKVTATQDEFLDTQSEIKRRLAAGESIADIMSDDDDEEDEPV